MLEHVSRGQKLTTDLVNGIIDKANGQMIPSNGAFVNTQNGTLFINEGKSLSPNTPFITNTFLDCKIFKRAELESRPFTYKDITSSSDLKRQIFINLGNSVDAAKSLIQYNGKSVDEIILAGGTNQNLDYILDDTILNPANDSNNKLTVANDGFVNTAILFSNSVKIYGQIYKYFKEEPEEDEEVKEPKFYFVVTDQTDVKQRVLDLTGDEESDGYILKKTYQTQLGLITKVGTNSNANKANYLINAKPITLVDDVNISSTATSADIPPDASLPDLHLSSVENYERSDGSLYRRLYNFDSEVEEFTESDLSNNYDFIIRHTNDDGEKYIVYKSLSSLNGILSVAEISGDSQVDSTTTDYTTSSYSVELLENTEDEKFYSLYKFNVGCANGSFKYLSSDEDGNRAFGLDYYSFSTGETKTVPLENYDVTLLTRVRDNDNNELIYVGANTLAEFTKGLSGVNEISGDSQQEDTLSKSVALSSIDGKKCYTLYNFNGGCAEAYLTQEAPYEYLGCDAFAITYFGENDMLYDYAYNCQLLMRLNKDDSGDCELKYLDLYSLTSILPNTDTEIFAGCDDGQKSIEIKYGCAEIDGYYRQIQAYQLYGIDRPSDIEEEYTKTVIKRQGNDPDSDYGDSNYTESLLPEGYEFVVRTVNSEGCGTIHYMPLSVGVELPETDTKVGISKSVTVRDDNGEYLTLYNFTEDNVGSYTANYEDYIDSSGFFVDGCDGILFRKITNLDYENQEPELHYITFQSLKDYVQPIGDADAASKNDADENDSYSIEIKTTKHHIDYYQLYNFDDASIEDEYIRLDPDSHVCLNVDDDAFLVRTTDENGQPVLKYKQIYVKQAPGGNTNIEEDITNIYDQINYLSAEIYNLSGTCSCDLSGAWVRGGTYEENYGCSIGDSYQYEVINLDGRTLMGCWNQSNGSMCFYNSYNDNYNSTIIDGGCVNVDNQIYVGTQDPTYIGDGCIGASGIYGTEFSGCIMTLTDRIIIGCTELTESQLQQLLALLN